MSAYIKRLLCRLGIHGPAGQQVDSCCECLWCGEWVNIA